MFPRRRPTHAWIGIAFALACALCYSAAGAETIRIHIEYPQEALLLSEKDGFTSVRLPRCELLPRAGAPALPYIAEQVVLPEGMTAVGVEVNVLSSVRIPCGRVAPAQPPAILGLPGFEQAAPERVPPDPAVYEGIEIYPADLVVFRGTGRMAGHSIASCEVHPVRYDPSTQELLLHTEIALTLQLEQDPNAHPATGTQREMRRIVDRLARNRMHGTENLPTLSDTGAGVALDPGAYQYVIVTSDEQRSAYETYAAWKTAKGVPATVVTVEWIDTAYTGRDLAEKIRNFIVEAVDDWGTSYVLIGGDEQIVPSRISWAFDCEAGFYPNENDLYADLYYSDLDGDWDENANDIFGEVDDNVDLYPDILVGRSPTDDLDQATVTVNKFLTYEQTPPTGQAMEAFFFAEILWSDPYTDSGIGKDMIGDRHFGDAYEPIERQYESMGNETVASVLSYLNTGPHLANHAGHANEHVMGCGDGYMDRDDAAALTNGPRYFVLYSIGCWAAAFDYGCIGEFFVVNGDGGAIAFIGNSRYGWGSPGNPGWGYSETFDSDFYGAILTEGLTQFGAAVAWPKILRIPYSQEENVYRWHEYQVNLLGDPEMACHTAEITAMTLETPTSIPVGSTQFTATLFATNGPVAGARLCLTGTDLYMIGFTDDIGQVGFSLTLPSAQELTLTATAPNHPYVVRSIYAAGDDPFLTVASNSIDDDAVAPSAGNGDGEIGAGEVIELFVTVHNYGGEACSGVVGSLSDAGPQVVIIENAASYGTIPADGEVTNAAPFVFQVAHGCPPGETIPFTLTLQDELSNEWVETMPLTVVRPGPRFHHYFASELIGDDDGIVEPGETVAVTVTVKNEGDGDLSPMSATLTTTDPNLVVLQGSASTSNSLAPGEMGALNPAFEIYVESGCPETTYGTLDFALTHDEGNDSDSFLLAIGEPGLEDDMESGPNGWTHSGTNDLWHLTDYRQHSGSESWYCGTAAYQYVNNMDATLLSPTFVAPEDAELSFWCYFDVTTYGVDGLFIEIWDDSGWQTLDYLGSGGALDDSLLFTIDWAEHRYDVGDFTPGALSQVRFRFASDGSDVAEGFFVDDVVIRAPSTASIELPLFAGSLALSPTRPNPVVRDARWWFSLPEPAHVSAVLYDASGRVVRSLLRGSIAAGNHELRWDGRTRSGSIAPTGIYFLRVQAGPDGAVSRVVHLRR